MSILGEFLPLERSAKQVSLLAGLLTLQRPGRLERTGGISVFCICNQVWTAPPSLPEPQVRDNRLAPQVPTVKVIYSTASLYLRPAEWPSTHHELGGQPPAASETSSALDGGPFPQPQRTINLVRQRRKIGLQRTPFCLLLETFPNLVPPPTSGDNSTKPVSLTRRLSPKAESEDGVEWWREEPPP